MSTLESPVAEEVLQQSFRAAMRVVAAPVSVVTLFAEGRPFGSTVSAFSSLSMSPPLMLVSLDVSSSLLARVELGTRLGINVLGAHQSEHAAHFAQRHPDKFRGVRWELRDGAPAIDGVRTWVGVTVVNLVRAGDHVIVVGAVDAAEAGDAAPLTYWRRTFGTHQEV